MKTTKLINGFIGGSASITPDGKYVVYVLWKDGNKSIHYRQVSSGSDVEIVSLGENVDEGPTTISPDGDSVYYTINSREYPQWALFQVSIIGGRAPRKILENIKSAISFAPDGKRFVFVRADPNTSETGIYVGTIDGKEPYLLARRSGQNFFVGHPAWSPDGKVIIAPAGTYIGGEQYSLVEIAVDGGAERAFTKFKWYGTVMRPLWFRDGTGLVVNAVETPTSTIQIWQVSYPQGVVTRITKELTNYGGISFGLTADSSTIVSILDQINSQVWLANAGEDEGRARKVTDGKNDGNTLAILPDGRFVYSVVNGENQDVWIMNADGSGQKQLFSNADPKGGFNVTPDGHYILYHVFRPGESAYLVRLSVDTGEEKRLTFGDFSDYDPFSSPDSRTVYFGSMRTGNYRLWKMSIDGGEPTQVTDLAFSGVGFLPDGKLIRGDVFDEQVTPHRWRTAQYSLADNRIVKIYDYPEGTTAVHRTLDENTFMYGKREAGIDNMWIGSIDGGPAKQLTRFSSLFIWGFAVSPDYKHFAFARGTESEDLILIKNFR